MSIEEEIARLRRGQANQEAAARHDAAVRAEGADRVRARMEGRMRELSPLGQTFVQWARASRIKPTTLSVRIRNMLICTRSVPTLKGWVLENSYAVSNEDRGGWGGNNRQLVVTTSGDIQWMGKSVIVTLAEAEQAIAAYVVRSRSRVPWPSSPGGSSSASAVLTSPPGGPALSQYDQYLASSQWNGSGPNTSLASELYFGDGSTPGQSGSFDEWLRRQK